jgi:serine phosphatase RsbU (regulator of sigma subunit)
MELRSFNPLILIHNDDIIVIKANRFPVGYHEVNGNFTLHEFNIEKNDIIYLFSDGIIDQFGGTTTKRFMLKHLKELLLGNHNDTMVRQKEILKEELNRWKGPLYKHDNYYFLQ